jgi:hypothetical protein
MQKFNHGEERHQRKLAKKSVQKWEGTCPLVHGFPWCLCQRTPGRLVMLLMPALPNGKCNQDPWRIAPLQMEDIKFISGRKNGREANRKTRIALSSFER